MTVVITSLSMETMMLMGKYAQSSSPNTAFLYEHNPESSLQLQNPFVGTQTPNEQDFPYANSMQKKASMDAMREMIFRIAMMQPIHIDPVSIKPPRRKNVRISKDPQSVAARHRRERISEKIRILQRMVPGGTKMDTASMLDEAALYLKFLKKQVQSLEQTTPANDPGIPTASKQAKSCQHQHAHMLGSIQMLSFGS